MQGGCSCLRRRTILANQTAIPAAVKPRHVGFDILPLCERRGFLQAVRSRIRCPWWVPDTTHLQHAKMTNRLTRRVPPLSSLVNSLKGVSSYVLRRQLPRITKGYWNHVLWSPSCFAASCGGAPLDRIKRYIEQPATPLKSWLTPACMPGRAPLAGHPDRDSGRSRARHRLRPSPSRPASQSPRYRHRL